MADSDEDDLLSVDWGLQPPVIPDGEYVAKFLRSERAFVFKTEKIFLHFEILAAGDANGARLFRAYRLSQPDSKKGKKVHGRNQLRADRRGLLLEMMARVFDKNPRRDQLSLRDFRGRLFRVLVRTVKTTRDSESRKQVPLPEWRRYSVIDDILRIEAGAPPEP